MKKLLVVVALISLFCIPAIAQNVPQFEIFGGYSLIRADSEDFGIPTEEAGAVGLGGFNLHGFLASVEGNVNSWFGIVGEFGYDKWSQGFSFSNELSETNGNVDLDAFTALFGPRFSYRGEGVRIFAHYLLGFARASVDATATEESMDEIIYEDSESYSDTALGQVIGGGIDLAVKNYVSVRPAQIDLLSTRFGGGDVGWQHFFRYSGGIVFTFGSK